MPYLNWETAKNHAEAKAIIQTETDRAMTGRTETSNQPQLSQCSPMSPLSGSHSAVIGNPEASIELQPIRSVAAAVVAQMPAKRTSISLLGQLFLDVANLHQAMSTYKDRMVLKTNLHNPPSLHPRRSMDQAQYGDENSAKDKDQVVYRATNVGIKEYQCANPGLVGDDEKGSKQVLRVPGTAKLIMVDQLWMWILDKHTVITAFPKRWGSTQSDPSDVHQAIRNRMQLRSTRDWNAFDLALIIIDECADALFNESSNSQRPQVLDIFTEAIGFARRRQTQSLKRILYWSNAASRKRQLDAAKDILDLQLPIFDIGNEAALQMELNDITDELEMMIQIFKTQQALVGSFRDQGQLELRPIPDGDVGIGPAQARFLIAAKEILGRFDDRVRNLEELRGRAQNVSNSVSNFGLPEQLL